MILSDIDMSNGGYHCVLDLIDRFFDGELDQATFEDSVRYIFPTQAYELFTIDKLTHAVIKQVHAALWNYKEANDCVTDSGDHSG